MICAKTDIRTAEVALELVQIFLPIHLPQQFSLCFYCCTATLIDLVIVWGPLFTLDIIVSF